MAKSFLLQQVLVASLSVTSVSMVSVVSLPAYASQDNLPAQFRSDKDYHTNIDKARSMLQARGYQVKDISAKIKDGQRYLEIEAYKGAAKYEVDLYYPDLKIVKEKLDK